jgi:predicted DNA binding protein
VKEVVLAVRTPEGPFCEVIKNSLKGASLRDFRIGRRKETFHHLVELHPSSGEFASVLKRLRSTTSIKDVDVVREEPHKLVAEVVTSGCPMCRQISSFNCFVMGAHSESADEIRWRLLVEQKQPLEGLVEALRGIGAEVQILKMAKVGRAGRVTPREDEILRVALEAGYFEYPRRVGLRKLAGIMKVRPGTLSETLRRAERNLVREYVRREGG